MQVHAGCAIPEEYLYDLEFDNWVRLEHDGTATLGMTDVAQTRCGKIVHDLVQARSGGGRARPQRWR